MPGFGFAGGAPLGFHSLTAASLPAPAPAPGIPTPAERVLAIDAENRVLIIFK